MKKIALFSTNDFFAIDLSQQITRVLPETEVCLNELDNADLILVDEDLQKLQDLSVRYKELPLIFLSSSEKTSDLADVVIEKPFILAEFLKALKNNTLLPKVRRKECLSFKEYSLYPIKKEIYSSKTGKTIKLTEKEVKILKYLYQNLPENVSKEDLLENVWGYSTDVTTHTIETHIYRLRQKVEQDNGSQIIITENYGYRLNI